MNAKKRPRKNQSTMRMLGKQLQSARKAAGYTQSSLAEAALADEETIASIEQGRRALLPDLAATLDELLDTKGMLLAGVENLPEVDQFPLNAEQFNVHVREATAISWYECVVMPGLLQTPEYARALFRDRVPAYDEDEIEARTADRIGLQEVLHRTSPPTLSFVVWEPALHLRVGGDDVCRAQLLHLRTLTELRHLVVQFLPLDAPSHAGLAGPFTILETPDHQRLVYAASQLGSHWIADPNEAANRAHKYAMLRSQALTPQESKGLLDRLLGDQ
ncbi:helix-turn-helix transcriptional regulator [Streptomyces sp. 769]|uniref:helix-turn-helix domain-containing protein n=1 Tax=Streptomyces sp. 769 TaxID=1262452 RepID=UPI00057F9266|nr:helix-turn-helix transcriptional regulator [Streptomyces sp. 769]AJC57514.1 DNA-binding protein [Streptomyces sp. 769]